MPDMANAYVNDALSFAYEAAQPYVEKKGYTVRKENWLGTAKSSKAIAVRHHLTKGNSYWFWLGVDADKAKLVMRIYDKKGKALEAETKGGKNWAGARIEVPKTGTYVIAFRIKAAGQSSVDWALAYGYK